MHDSNTHEKKNLETYYFDNLLKNLANFSKKIFRYLLNMDVEKKKAVSFTLIIMTLCFFLGARDVFILNHILCISYDSFEIDGSMINLDDYIVNYIIFLIMWSPAIYLLSLYWNRKTPKFHLSLAYATGLLTYRLGHNEWGLYNSNNFMSCLGTAALFVFIAAILIRFFREVQE